MIRSVCRFGHRSSKVWNTGFAAADGVQGLRVRTSMQAKENVEVMLEDWKKGSYEPPHSHPGDDMTVVIDGQMTVTFFLRLPATGELKQSGAPLVLKKGDVGYVPANSIHDAKYDEDCKLVYVHSGAFGFVGEKN